MTDLRLHVTFPSCWDGRRVDSADHQSHMAYAMRGRCPSTHPVAVPAISLIFRYPIAGGAGVSLTSGGQYSAHADFFNAWRQPALASLVDGCLNTAALRAGNLDQAAGDAGRAPSPPRRLNSRS